MKELGYQPTATTYTALVSAYSKADDLDGAMEVRVRPDFLGWFDHVR